MTRRPGVTVMFLLLSAAGGIVSLAGFAGRFHWTLDLCTHFQAQYFCFQALCLAILLALKNFRLALLPLFFLVSPALALLPYHFPTAAAGPSARDVRVSSFNVLYRNTRYEDAVRWTLETNPDLAFFTEVNDAWAVGLEPLKARYPHSVVKEQRNAFGFALFSRYPLVETTVFSGNGFAVPMLKTSVIVDGRKIMFFGAHPPPPVGPVYARERDEYLLALASEVSRTDLPVILAGDLNATPWSHPVRPLFQAGLRDTMIGRGYSATWMRENPLITVPIDHFFVKGDLKTVDRWTGPDLGSDHRPLVADFSW